MNQPVNINGAILSNEAIEVLLDLQRDGNTLIDNVCKNCNDLSSIVLNNRSGISPDSNVIFGLLENINEVTSILSGLKAKS